MSEEVLISTDLPEEPKVWFQNHGLFSDHFIKARLPEQKEWQTGKEITDLKVKILALYESQKAALQYKNEAQTEKDFIQPVLDFLDYSDN